MIRVDYEGASKATQLGGSPPGVLGRLIHQQEYAMNKQNQTHWPS
jgi:hypothetical protein